MKQGAPAADGAWPRWGAATALTHDVTGDGNASVADIRAASGDEFVDVTVRPTAEGAGETLPSEHRDPPSTH